jgi:hypothetical protein
MSFFTAVKEQGVRLPGARQAVLLRSPVCAASFFLAPLRPTAGHSFGWTGLAVCEAHFGCPVPSAGRRASSLWPALRHARGPPPTIQRIALTPDAHRWGALSIRVRTDNVAADGSVSAVTRRLGDMDG